MRVSLVIPAYNEEHHLKACLDAVAAQTVAPFEVIVVDNGSTDQTVAIARSFPFVKLIHEKRQGVVFARDAGFNAATGDIIGRIDSDTVLPPYWVRDVCALFSDTHFDAISGRVRYYDVALRPVADGVDFFFRKYIARRLARSNTLFLQGANLAMRRQAWLGVRDAVCHRDAIHEDFDLAIHLQQRGFAVGFDETLTAAISGRRTAMQFTKALHYLLVSPRTYAVHKLRSRIYMYPIVAVSIVLYWPARIIYLGYDPTTGGFSFERLLENQGLRGRLDPSTIFSE